MLPSKGTGANKVSFMGSFLLLCFVSFQFHIEFASTLYVLQYWVKPLASLIWSLIKILFPNVYFILYFLFYFIYFFNNSILPTKEENLNLECPRHLGGTNQ